MTVDAIGDSVEPIKPKYDRERRRRFFTTLGDRALSKLVGLGDTGGVAQPDDAEEDKLIDQCLELYRSSPAEDDELGADLSIIVVEEVLKKPLRESSIRIVDTVTKALQASRGGEDSGYSYRFQNQARAAVSVPRTSALSRVTNQVRDLLLDGELDRPEIPEKSIETINDDLRYTIIDIMNEGYIDRRDAVGLILACGLERYSDDKRMKIEQSIAKDRVVSSIQIQLAERTFTFDVSTLKALVGHSEQTNKTRGDVIKIIATKYGLTYEDADKVVGAELAHDLMVFYQGTSAKG